LNSNKLLGSLKHIINVIMWIRYTGCYIDDPDGLRYLELKVGVAEDGHELVVTGPLHDDMVRLREVDHLE
jgi:hypothetical protein